MSRRRGEFEHRTSLFEGASRAWSHLGGLEPHALENKSASDLDPLTNPLFENDSRVKKKEKGTDRNNNKHATKNDSGGGCCGGGVTDNNSISDPQDDGYSSDNNNLNNDSNAGEHDEFSGNDDAEIGAVTSTAPTSSSGRHEYPYEPLPRSGLSHPFVQAILSPWLGPDADQEAIQLGLTTLRTWWQHRRKGESGSAITALRTERMCGVVEGYTRHFFNLAHCLVINDGEQPPRTLHTKMKQLEKIRNKNAPKKSKKNNTNNGNSKNANNNSNGSDKSNNTSNSKNSDVNADKVGSQLLSSKLSPLERLHAAQRQKMQNGNVSSFNSLKSNVKADSTNSSLTSAETILSSSFISPDKVESSAAYGDPNKTPVVFVSENGDIQIAMSIEGITCAHCVKIVETVLRGCNGKKSPINGLLDAAADRALAAVLIKLDQSSNAKRIAFEAARNLALVGYVAKAKEMKVVDMYTHNGIRGNGGQKMQLNMLSTAFEVVASVEKAEVFNWHHPCTCPDNGVLRDDCPRHSQMNKLIFETFDRRAQQVSEFITGCGKNIDLMNADQSVVADTSSSKSSRRLSHNSTTNPPQAAHNAFSSRQVDGGMAHPNHHDTMLNSHMPSEPSGGNSLDSDSVGNLTFGSSTMASATMASASMASASNLIRSGRNNSLTSWGSNNRFGKSMSITSENTFGRAMSGLSALSIDWENMEDFDVNVDHSAHINNGEASNPVNPQQGIRNYNNATEPAYPVPGEGLFMYSVSQPVRPGATRRRSSLKKNIPIDSKATQNMQVSFQL